MIKLNRFLDFIKGYPSIIAVFLIALYSLNSNAQFIQTAGSSGIEYFYSVIEAHDGGYIAAGQTNSIGAGLEDIYLVKLDVNGNMLWSKSIGGSGQDIARRVIKTFDGGYAVAGYSSSFGAVAEDFIIIKLDDQFNLQWSKIIGGNLSELLYSIIQTPDSGFVCAGMTNSYGAGGNDVLLVKLNASGNLQWSKSFGGSLWDQALSLINTADGGFAVSGVTSSFGEGNADVLIAKFSGNGTLQWSRTVGGYGVEEAYGLTQSSDGGLVVSGWTNSFGSDYDCYAVKLDVNGSLQWSRIFGLDSWDIGNSIISTNDNGYIIAGRTIINDYYDCYLAKLDVNGNLLWNRSTGNSFTEVFNAVIQTNDNKFVGVGRTNSVGSGSWDGLIMKMDGNGDFCSNSNSHNQVSYTGGVAGNPSFIFNTVSPVVNSASPSFSTGGSLTNVCNLVNLKTINYEIPKLYVLNQNYPNPFNPTTKISYELPVSGNVKLTIYNSIGQTMTELVNTVQNAGRHEVEWNATAMPSGLYFYRIEAESFTDTRKMLLVK